MIFNDFYWASYSLLGIWWYLLVSIVVNRPSPLVIIPVHASHISCHPGWKIFKTWMFFFKKMLSFQSCKYHDCLMTAYLVNPNVFIIIVTDCYQAFLKTFNAEVSCHHHKCQFFDHQIIVIYWSRLTTLPFYQTFLN